MAETNEKESEFVLLTDESVVFVYESRSDEKTPNSIFAYALSQDFRNAKEEFTRYDIVQDLQSEIEEKLRQAEEVKTVGVIVRGRLREYDFERKLFPINLAGGPEDYPRRIWFDQHYAVELLNVAGKIELPVPFESAKKLAGELQKSREVECVVVGRIRDTGQGNDNRLPPVKVVSVQADHITVRFANGQEVGSLELSVPSS